MAKGQVILDNSLWSYQPQTLHPGPHREEALFTWPTQEPEHPATRSKLCKASTDPSAQPGDSEAEQAKMVCESISVDLG